MKMITLENIYRTLVDEAPEVDVPADVAAAARRSIENMISIK